MKKILVVEDAPINRMILSDFLAANGYETVAAASGPEGIERFDRDQSSCTIQLGKLADGYLSKPFDLVQLLSQVRELLGEPK